jgi:hypothetical protein
METLIFQSFDFLASASDYLCVCKDQASDFGVRR